MSWVINNLQDLAQAIASYISQAIETLIYCIFYPFECIFYWLSAITNIIIDSIKGIINNLWNIYDIIYTHISIVLNNMFPYTFTIIILIGLTIVFLLKIYYFIRGSR